MIKKKYIYIFFLFFFVLWEPFHVYLFPYDGNYRMISILGIIFLLFGLRNLNRTFIANGKRFDLILLVWVIWVTINTTFFNPLLDPTMDNWIFFTSVILPFIIYLGIRLNFYNLDLEKQWLWYLIALLFYLGLVVLFDVNNSKTGRLGEFLNSNDISWVALLALFSSSLIKNKKLLKYGTIFFSLVLILLTQSKKTLLSFILFFALMFLIEGKMTLVKRISIIAFFGIVLNLMIPFLMERTQMGERILETVERNNEAEDDSELFDGRAGFYVVGMNLFKKKPFIGYGIRNFMYISGMDQVAHSEYVVQFVELGLIGFLIFSLFHFRIISTLIGSRQLKNHVITKLLISVIIIYGMFLGRWVYDHIQYNIFLALLINTIVGTISDSKGEYQG